MLAFTILATTQVTSANPNLAQNSDFAVAAANAPQNYALTGAAKYGIAGYKDEFSTPGVLLDSTAPTGEVSQTVPIDQSHGRWIKFQIRGKAEDGFQLSGDELYMSMDFYGGAKYEDRVKRLIYREITRDRKDFAVNGDNHKNGAAVWRTYELEELLPFAETDNVKFTVGFAGGSGADHQFSRFMVNEFDVIQESQSSEGKQDPADRIHPSKAKATSTNGMIHLGGRWYYLPKESENIPLDSTGRLTGPLLVTERNSSQLFYKDDRLENPFEGNMTAWLRKGFLDEQGNLVTQDRFVPDNVTVEFDSSGFLTIHARNIPNHPTAQFPDTYGTQGYNPSYIQEHDYAWKLPLEPKLRENPVAVDTKNTGMALPMGAIGVAINGVVFYNPFDAGMQDASGIMDRCCGHPSPDNRYHYHKYPICVNTPFLDKGEAHSPIIGFAWDGLPIYGPYESSGVLAKDSKNHPLNPFNAHYDPDRGWHYHVTPGQFPYIIGGYFGEPVNEGR